MNKKPIIPFTIERGIKARAKKINREFPIFDREDLIQDGYVLVLQVLRKKPEASPAYLMTALKRFYSHQRKKAYIETVSRAELSDSIRESFAVGPPRSEYNIDRERITVKMKTKADSGATEYAVLVLADEYGLNSNEIRELLGKDAMKGMEENEKNG